MRWALLGPTPGSRPSSSMRSWTAPSYTPEAYVPSPTAAGPARRGDRGNRLDGCLRRTSASGDDAGARAVDAFAGGRRPLPRSSSSRSLRCRPRPSTSVAWCSSAGGPTTSTSTRSRWSSGRSAHLTPFMGWAAEQHPGVPREYLERSPAPVGGPRVLPVLHAPPRDEDAIVGVVRADEPARSGAPSRSATGSPSTRCGRGSRPWLPPGLTEAGFALPGIERDRDPPRPRERRQRARAGPARVHPAPRGAGRGDRTRRDRHRTWSGPSGPRSGPPAPAGPCSTRTDAPCR